MDNEETLGVEGASDEHEADGTVTQSNALVAMSTILAERTIAWAPGIPGGIPKRSVAINVKDAPYRAMGNGTVDDTKAIQDAIYACPDGQAVRIPKGVYRLTKTLLFMKPDGTPKKVVLRGDGPGQTILRTSAAGSGIEMSVWSNDGVPSSNIVSGFRKGATQVTVDVQRFQKGDYVVVSQENDPGLVQINGGGGACKWCGEGGARAMSQVTVITGVSGTTLTLGRPLYFPASKTSGFNPRPRVQLLSFKSTGPIKNAGIEDLTIDRISGAESNIRIARAVNCWVRNVESSHAALNHVQLMGTLGCEVRDSYFHHGFNNNYEGGNAYGVMVFGRNSDALIENNVFYYLRHSMVMEGGGSGNVFGYNYSTRMFDQKYPDTNWQMCDLMTHGAHPFMNLYEGNKVGEICFDNVWGSSSHNTVFRNHAINYSKGERAEVIYARYAAIIDKNNHYETFLGNVLGLPGDTGQITYTPNTPFRVKATWRIGYRNTTAQDAPETDSTLVLHGNYDYIYGKVSRNSTIATYTPPASLYLKSKPVFFGEKLWPLFGVGPKDVPFAGTPPAEDRFKTLGSH